MTHEDFFKLMGFKKVQAKDSQSVWYEKPMGALRGISIWPPKSDIWYLDYGGFGVYTTAIRTSLELDQIQELYKTMENIRFIYKLMQDTNNLMPLKDEFKQTEKEEK